MKELVIGNVVLENPYILAPMAGVCDLPFRVICSQMGAGMVCMEIGIPLEIISGGGFLIIFF